MKPKLKDRIRAKRDAVKAKLAAKKADVKAKVKKTLASSLVVALASLPTGCTTSAARIDGGWGEPYVGTRVALGYCGALPILLADIPFDAVADTALLPIDLICMPFVQHGYFK